MTSVTSTYICRYMQWIPPVRCLTSHGVETLKSKASRTWQGFGSRAIIFRWGSRKIPLHTRAQGEFAVCCNPKLFTKRNECWAQNPSVRTKQCSDLNCQTLLHHETSENWENNERRSQEKLPQLWVRVFWWRSFRYCVHKKDEQFSFSKLSRVSIPCYAKARLWIEPLWPSAPLYVSVYVSV